MSRFTALHALLFLLLALVPSCTRAPAWHGDTGFPHAGPPAHLRVTVHAESMVDGAPLEPIQVTVRGPGPSQTAASPNEERRSFEDLVPGTWTVRATSTQTGCENTCEGEVTVEIGAGEALDLDLPMSCDSACTVCFDPLLPGWPQGLLGEARARMAHLVGDVGGLDLYINDDPTVFTNRPIEPRTTTDHGENLFLSFDLFGRPDPYTGYARFPAETDPVGLLLQLVDSEGTTVFAIEPSFVECGVGTMVLMGRSGSADFPPQWRMFDDDPVWLAADPLAVSVVHAWPTADRVDLWTCPAVFDDLTGSSAPCDTTAPPVATDLAFGDRGVLAGERNGPRVLTLARTGETDVLAHYEWRAEDVSWAYIYLGPDTRPGGGPEAWWHLHQQGLVALGVPQ